MSPILKVFRRVKRRLGFKRLAETTTDSTADAGSPNHALNTRPKTPGTRDEDVENHVGGSVDPSDKGLAAVEVERAHPVALVVSSGPSEVQQMFAPINIGHPGHASGQSPKPSQPNELATGSQSARRSAEPVLSLEEKSALMWDSAYDSLKQEHPNMVNSYELILSYFIEKKARLKLVSLQELSLNIIEKSDRSARLAQMNHLLDIWLSHLGRGGGWRWNPQGK